MKKNAQLMPMITVDSVDQARAFYVEKLGFGHMMGMLGKDGQLDFCTVTLGGAKVMLMRPQQHTAGTNATLDKATSRDISGSFRRRCLPRRTGSQGNQSHFSPHRPVVGRPDLHRDRSLRISDLVLPDGG